MFYHRCHFNVRIAMWIISFIITDIMKFLKLNFGLWKYDQYQLAIQFQLYAAISVFSYKLIAIQLVINCSYTVAYIYIQLYSYQTDQLQLCVLYLQIQFCFNHSMNNGSIASYVPKTLLQYIYTQLIKLYQFVQIKDISYSYYYGAQLYLQLDTQSCVNSQAKCAARMCAIQLQEPLSNRF